MPNNSILLQGWRSLWDFRPNPGVPLAARLLAATLLAVVLALGLMSLVAVFGRVNVPGWWWISLLPNIGICLCIVHTLFAVLRVAGHWLPPSLVERMADVRDLRAGMLLSALALGAIILGMTIGFTIVPILLDFDLWGMFHSMPVALTKFAVFLLFVMGANWAWWRARLRRQQLERDALDARLRLLQGQIEPHLLFNTLANVPTANRPARRATAAPSSRNCVPCCATTASRRPACWSGIRWAACTCSRPRAPIRTRSRACC